MKRLRLTPAVNGHAMLPVPVTAASIRPWRLSALWSLSAVLLVAPAHGAALVPTAQPPKRHTPRAVARPPTTKRRGKDDEYAHVYYELSATRGFHVYVRALGGAQREITDEPGWEARHNKALEAHHRARRERYVRLHPDLAPAMREAIETGRFVRGMTTEQARACAGRPLEEKRVLTHDGLVEDWRYGMELLDGTGELPHFDMAQSCTGPDSRAHGSSCVLHFIDGALVDWESTAAGAATAARRSAPP